MSSNEYDLNYSDIADVVDARFRAAFGEPSRKVADGNHWSLHIGPGGNNINMFLNGSPRNSTLWVFDPNDHENAVNHLIITEAAQIDDVIGQLQERIKRAQAHQGRGA